MKRAAGYITFWLLFWAGAGAALDLNLPSNARETASNNSALDSYVAPTGPFQDGSVPGVRVEGEVRRSAFRVSTAGLTPLQLLQPLRAQLEEDGFKVILDCAAARCGGFDFRFATETLPAPAMHISLREFHFLTAVIGDAAQPERVVTLLASTSPAAAHLQIIQAGALGDAPDQFTRNADLPQVPVQASNAPEPANAGTGATDTGTTDTGGGQNPVADPALPIPKTPPLALPPERFVLEGLEFGTGSGSLGDGPFSALESLAEQMRANPDITVALVGHTDNTGPLDVNVTISRRRAEAVRQRLISAQGIAAGRVTSHGVGFLSPLADNSTEAGRTKNRRVEAVILPAN